MHRSSALDHEPQSVTSNPVPADAPAGLFTSRGARRTFAVAPPASMLLFYLGGAVHPKDPGDLSGTLRQVATHQSLWAGAHIAMACSLLAVAMSVPGFLLLARTRGARWLRVEAA